MSATNSAHPTENHLLVRDRFLAPPAEGVRARSFTIKQAAELTPEELECLSAELTPEELELIADGGPFDDLMKKTKPCPRCGKTLTAIAVECDCGWNIITG